MNNGNLTEMLKLNAWKITFMVFLTAGAVSYFFIYTSPGSKILTESVLSHQAQASRVRFEQLEGNLAKGITYGNVELSGLEGFPQGSRIRIQKIFVRLTSLSPQGLTLTVDNARLLLPQSDDPMVLWFSLKSGMLKGNLFTNSLRIQDILPFFPEGIQGHIAGTLTNVDLYLKGPYAQPEVSGNFHIEKILRDRFAAVDCPGSVAIVFKRETGDFKPFGEVLVRGGTVTGPKTAAVKLEDSKALFSGEWENPSLNFNGRASVEDTKIKIKITGTVKSPDLQLSSEPQRAQEKLLLMLATGRSWKGTEDLFSSKQISADLAKDFIDYFAFSGEGNALAKKFGISDVSVQFDKEAKGIGVTKDLSDRFKATYAVKQTQKTGELPETVQEIGGEVKLTDSISAEAKKEVLPKAKPVTDGAQELPPEKPNDEIYLKYKKSF